MKNQPVSRWRALIICIVLAAIVVVLDIISKDIAEAVLSDGPKPFIPGFLDFYLTYNSGAAWGLFSGARAYFVIIAAVVIIAVLAYILIQKQHSFLVVIGLGFFLGGSIGNAIDRLLVGAVVDFLRFLFISFPIFNIADSAITFGVGLLLLAILLSRINSQPEPLTAGQTTDVDP
ncbi:MAG: signal peptidase II [Coriobacteriales bacterium]|jgi:signal peptidase II|nr:signal peptidase II [Coriobacteriales bacterium]